MFAHSRKENKLQAVPITDKKKEKIYLIFIFLKLLLSASDPPYDNLVFVKKTWAVPWPQHLQWKQTRAPETYVPIDADMSGSWSKPHQLLNDLT